MSDERGRTTKSETRSVGEHSHVATPTADVARAPEPAASREAVEAQALAEEVDLTLDLRRHLLAMDNPDIDHYSLLGVEPSADKKAIKRAYFELAAKFHPDRYFRKKLGSFKLRLETFFSRLTIAHEALANTGARAEYDAYLEVQRRSRSIEQLLADAALEAKRVEEKVEREARAQEPVTPPTPPISDARMPTGPSQPSSLPPPSVNAAARRDAFARRLLGGRTSSPSVPPPSRLGTPTAAVTMTTADAMNALRRRYEERVALAKTAEARKCIARAEQALAAGEVIKAANAYRIASGLAPGDAELERKSREVQATADTLMGDTYERQAEYEEKSSNWPAAARSWVRVCQARPNDAHAHGRAAGALIKSGGDLHQAARLAQRVCELEPSTAGGRILLAEVYLAADLTHKARRELETAVKLGAHDGIIEPMLKRLEPPT